MYINHIGVRIHVSQSSESAYLNVVIKFDSKLSSNEREQVMSAISANSLCRGGCPSRERIEIRTLLEAIGLDVEAAAFDQLSSEVQSNSTSDLCSGLYGYYRLSCLYDVKMKGITREDIAVHRLVQEHDDTAVVKRSFVQSLRSDKGFDVNSNQSSRCKAHLSLMLLTVILVHISSIF